MSEEKVNALHTKIIDIILQSPLNIESIPDDIERAIYEQILEALQSEVGKSCARTCWCWLKSCVCCKKRKNKID